MNITTLVDMTHFRDNKHLNEFFKEKGWGITRLIFFKKTNDALIDLAQIAVNAVSFDEIKQLESMNHTQWNPQ
jgi:hypothetical protein